MANPILLCFVADLKHLQGNQVPPAPGGGGSEAPGHVQASLCRLGHCSHQGDGQQVPEAPLRKGAVQSY